jgi:hypothetical protein
MCSRDSPNVKNAFLCPNGCDSWTKMDCSVSEKYYDLSTGIDKTEANIYRFDPGLNKLLFATKIDVFRSTGSERQQTGPVTDALFLVTLLIPPS